MTAAITPGREELLALADLMEGDRSSAHIDMTAKRRSIIAYALRLAAKPADDVRELQRRVKRYGSFCDTECEGRCRECPDELIRDLAASLSPTGAPKP